MRTMTRHSVQTFCFLLICASAGLVLAQTPPAQVVVFGDSLSDPGNGFALIKESSTPPDYGVNPLLVPDAPYARGGHHLTNGPTWIEQLAGSLGLERSALPAFVGKNPYAMNFAIGTTRARVDGSNPSLSLQVGAFLQKVGGQAPDDALYVIEVGGNDVRDALASGNPGEALAILQAAAAAIGDNISLLYASGARRFLVWNVPDAGLTPAARLSGTTAAATLATQSFNALLAAQLSPLFMSGVDITPFDANGLITAIVAAPGASGLTNVTDACITPNNPPFTCQVPDEYLFWDGIHPTAAAHAIVARAAAIALGF